jgi:GIY-YIG catalytic domain
MKEHEYFVYIVSSRSGTLYIGITNSIIVVRWNIGAAKSRDSPANIVVSDSFIMRALTTFTRRSDVKSS